ncbi:DUF1697 domain-containing protein [Rummeliibacillus pycnus]|uniref:DUF1697 domain-containing protein n=1 Tax=Rummeliibacillus pycnus TaxID=101070 RepID=UPI0037C8230E
MTIYIALLRGINVGGHNIVKMQDLRSTLENLGLDQVKTYIQSGNIIFQSDENMDRLQNQIEQEINNRFGFFVPVILRTELEWEALINNCPYPQNSLVEGESVHVALLEKEPTKESVNYLLEFKSENEECFIQGKEVYLFLRQSFRNAKIPIHIQKLGVPITIRNWKTIMKLSEMVSALSN